MDIVSIAHAELSVQHSPFPFVLGLFELTLALSSQTLNLVLLNRARIAHLISLMAVSLRLAVKAAISGSCRGLNIVVFH